MHRFRSCLSARLLLLTTTLLLTYASAHADWVLDGDNIVNGSLNVDIAQNAYRPKVAMIGFYPVVVWWENSTTVEQVYVKQYNGIQWTQLGAGGLNVNPAAPAKYPDIAVSNDTPFVTWVEVDAVGNTLVYAKRWNGSSWEALGNSLNMNASAETSNPSIAAYNGTPYVAWSEASDIYVKRLNGSQWDLVGSGRVDDVGQISSYPDITTWNGTPYVAFQDWNIDSYVKYFNGSSWVQIGSDVNNPSQSAYYPSLDVYNGTPYVTYQGIGTGITNQVYAKKWNGSGWELLGGSLNENASWNGLYPDIEVWNGTSFVTFSEALGSNYRVYVKHYNGFAWELDGSKLNFGTNLLAGISKIKFNSLGTPSVAWYENDGSVTQIFVKHYIFPTPTPTFTISPTSTISPTPTISPTSTVTPTITITYTITPTYTISPTRTITPTNTPLALVGGDEVLAYPNPAKEQINLMFNLPGDALVKFEVFSITGDKVAQGEEQVNDNPNARITWAPEGIAPGIYLVRLKAEGAEGKWEYKVKKVAIVR